MFEGVIIGEQGLIVMHMMCGTIVLDPYTIDSSHTCICCCFEAVRNTTENCGVGGGTGTVSSSHISLRIVSASTSASATSTAPAPPSPSAITASAAAAAALLRFMGFFCVIFFSDAFVAVLFGVISESTVDTRGESTWLSGRKDAV